LKMRH